MLRWRAVSTSLSGILYRLRRMGESGPLGVGALAAKYSFSAAIALLASNYVPDIIVTES